jgi:hypothetical protein
MAMLAIIAAVQGMPVGMAIDTRPTRMITLKIFHNAAPGRAPTLRVAVVIAGKYGRRHQQRRNGQRFECSVHSRCSFLPVRRNATLLVNLRLLEVRWISSGSSHRGKAQQKEKGGWRPPTKPLVLSMGSGLAEYGKMFQQ